ncbi:MAG: hypothetical protein LBQ60_10905 [Bacteroidales bacterium]|jgi:hypothetical protein|nr:hypothetical protein [Bacteroidales bacterium]
MRRVFFVFIISFQVLCFGQKSISGIYYNSFGEEIDFLNDSSFIHTWNFDLAGSWTKGKWRVSNDTIYLMPIIIKDTLTIRNSDNKIMRDSLVLSSDMISNRIEYLEFIVSTLSGGGQNRKVPPQKLYFRNNKLFQINKDGNLDKKKAKAILTQKKYKTYYQQLKQ